MSNLTGLDGKTQRHFGSLAGREREVKGHEWNDVYDRPESCWERFRVSTGWKHQSAVCILPQTSLFKGQRIQSLAKTCLQSMPRSSDAYASASIGSIFSQFFCLARIRLLSACRRMNWGHLRLWRTRRNFLGNICATV
jgi:hypothetical protein